MELSKRERQLFDLRKYSLDDKTIDNYLLDNSNLPGKRGNIELGFSFDMLICSYGLMQQELEMLSQVQWKIIVLDEAQARLKPLIKPFILRRIKSEVLEELPPKTEISLHVNMSYEEIAFYEAGQ